MSAPDRLDRAALSTAAAYVEAALDVGGPVNTLMAILRLVPCRHAYDGVLWSLTMHGVTARSRDGVEDMLRGWIRAAREWQRSEAALLAGLLKAPWTIEFDDGRGFVVVDDNGRAVIALDLDAKGEVTSSMTSLTEEECRALVALVNSSTSKEKSDAV